MPKNKYTMEYFRRYAKFYLQEVEEGQPNICWRVEATDSISTPGILEITAEEYYSNESEDDLENNIAGGLVVKHVEEEVEDTVNTIVGKTFIKPHIEQEYYFNGSLRTHWEVNSIYPVKITVDDDDIRKCKLTWTGNYSGQFDLNYGGFTKTIVVESLF
jgi:hypothetical protein